MRALKNYAGKRFGRLIARGRINKQKCEFQCDCGKSVVAGHTSSCGCIQHEMLIARNSTHGLSQNHRGTYRSWKDMRCRCYNENDSDYHNYGGRGIAVCARWNDFGAFFADMGERLAGLTLDRKDTNGNYEPGNCRWADAETQANNKRCNRVISINGKSKTLQQWSDEFGLDRSKVRYRLDVGYSPEEALKLEDFRRVGT